MKEIFPNLNLARNDVAVRANAIKNNLFSGEAPIEGGRKYNLNPRLDTPVLTDSYQTRTKSFIRVRAWVDPMSVNLDEVPPGFDRNKLEISFIVSRRYSFIKPGKSKSEIKVRQEENHLDVSGERVITPFFRVNPREYAEDI